jgi:hypothetical protein
MSLTPAPAVILSLFFNNTSLFSFLAVLLVWIVAAPFINVRTASIV